ncbi:MAG: carbohydrate ABC transporter permease [Ruminococcus sp.]|nr:carbohydrate ABC transporter permease [Ruminococcus sp.]MBQ8906121.1 carbohydrate ABC transporter permease [Ruminococcus sp.]
MSKTVYNDGAKGGYTAKIRLQSGLIFIVLVLLTIICLLPIYILAINSTRASADIASQGVAILPGSALLDNLKTLTTNEYYVKAFDPLVGFRNSIFLAAANTILGVFFSTLTAYGLVVYDFKLRGAATTFILAVMMVPTQVVSTGFLQFMIELDLHNSYWPLVIPSIAAPAIVFFMRQSMKSTFPLDIVEAARIDGCGEFRTFLTIAIPMMKPAIAVQSIFLFIQKWNDYYMTSMILISNKLEQRTIPMMVNAVIGNDKTPDFGVNYTTIAISIIPVVIIYLLLSKFIIAGVALGGVKE